MTDRHHRADDYRPLNPLWGTIALLSFGLAVLSFLVLLERHERFPDRPAGGVNAASTYVTATARPTQSFLN